MAIITKLEAAHTQLATAIRLFFDNEDLASVHTLACAAREIYEKHCEAKGVERMFEKIESSNPDRDSKQLWKILNGPRNFLKHPGPTMDLDVKLEIDDEMNATMLFVACHDCATLCEANQPPEMQAYNLWFIATRFPREGESTHSDPADQLRYGEIIAAIDRAYPGLRNASLSEQKAVGRKMILDARGLL
jgi:hypothetical protein